jgi:hypothetical protein
MTCSRRGFSQSDAVGFLQLGNGVLMFSDAEKDPTDNDFADGTTLPSGTWSILEPGPENGVEVMTYTPTANQPGFTAPSNTPDGKARVYVISSDTLNPPPCCWSA